MCTAGKKYPDGDGGAGERRELCAYSNDWTTYTTETTQTIEEEAVGCHRSYVCDHRSVN